MPEISSSNAHALGGQRGQRVQHVQHAFPGVHPAVVQQDGPAPRDGRRGEPGTSTAPGTMVNRAGSVPSRWVTSSAKERQPISTAPA